jgi:hypothetical protein
LNGLYIRVSIVNPVKNLFLNEIIKKRNNEKYQILKNQYGLLAKLYCISYYSWRLPLIFHEISLMVLALFLGITQNSGYYHNPLDNPYKLIDSVAETKIIIVDSS